MAKYGSTRTSVRLGAAAIALSALVAGALVAGASAAPAAPSSPRTGLVVTTAGGTLRGMTAGTTDEFLGIPYAAPPVGPLRWQPPQPAARWTGIRDATAFAPHCPQRPRGSVWPARRRTAST
jgi:para-nitrobenzyl esterase